MKTLGIYFGLKDINLVETSGRKILNNIHLLHPSLATVELEEKVPGDVKLIALLKDAFRTYRINADEAIFSVSGQDLVIRTFEIPLLPQNELKGAVNFEVKKYIPFKLEDLDYDFQVSFNKKNKTSLVLFVGIKKEILNSYISISKQLNLKVDLLEYSAFSILRFLKLAGLSDTGVVANLCCDLNNEDEGNFAVFENGFPLFSRDIVLVGGPAGFEQTVETDLIQKRDKLKNEIRASLEYYSRKFRDKDIKNIFVFSDKESRQELETFFSDSTIPVKFVDAQKVLGKNTPYSSMLVKSFAAALLKSAPLKITLNLMGAKLKADKSTVSGLKYFNFLEGFKLDVKFIFIGIALCIAVFGYGLMRIKPLQEELTGIKSNRVKVSPAVPNDDYETLYALNVKYRKKIATLDGLVKKQMYATYALDAIARALPKGVWLDNFSLNQRKGGELDVIINGEVYLGDNDLEFEAVNTFLRNLKNEPKFFEYFREMNINSIDRKTTKDRSQAVFTIVCKGSSGGN